MFNVARTPWSFVGLVGLGWAYPGSAALAVTLFHTIVLVVLVVLVAPWPFPRSVS